MRGLFRSVLVAFSAAGLVAALEAADVSPSARSPILQRFFATDDSPALTFRALRHLEAESEHFDARAWMDVWTEADPVEGFRYGVIAQGGSGYIRSHVFLKALETEREMWRAGEPDRAALTPENYVFAERPVHDGSLAAFEVKARRRDVLLVDGSIFLRPEDGELMRVEGRLTKTPSFWTRRVDVVRRYARVAGVRVPVSLESTANVLVAGRSTFSMTYDYELVNGVRVGSPE